MNCEHTIVGFSISGKDGEHDEEGSFGGTKSSLFKNK